MTKPYLYINGEQGHSECWWLPGNDSLKDAGARNLMPLDAACLTKGTGWGVSGSDAVSTGFQEPPELASTGTIADEAINAGVVGIEWTATGNSEQLTYQFDTQQVTPLETIGAGAWVYLEATGARNILIRWVGFDSSGSVSDVSGYGTHSVQPEEWTYITKSGVCDSDTEYVGLYIESNGGQTVGDKLYVGAAFIGYDESEWVYPTSPANQSIDLRFTAKILGDGAILSSRDKGGSDGNTFHIEAANQGFHVQTGTMALNTTVSTQTYTTATDIYHYNKWYDFRWTFDSATGDHAFYVAAEGNWLLIDSGSVTGRSAPLVTSYGIKTLESGLTVGGSNLLLDSFGMYTDEFGWGIVEDNAEDIIGSAITFDHAGSNTGNHSLFLDKSYWVINAGTGTEGAFELPDRNELDVGAGDFTLVQTFNAVDLNNGELRHLVRKYNTQGLLVRFESGQLKCLVGTSGNFTTLDLRSAVTNGTGHAYLFEREYGGDVNGYIDDFNTVVDTAADGSVDLDNTDGMSIGYYSTSSTYLNGGIGLTILFKRLLEDYERDDFQFWIESGYEVESEPDWLRSEATLYINPNDEAQQAAYLEDDSVINLALDVPDTLYVRHTFTSDDGVSNPVMSFHHLEVADRVLPSEGYRQAPKAVVDHGVDMPFKTWYSHSFAPLTIPFEELGPDWLNNDWTVGFWLREWEDGDATPLVSQGGTGTFEIRSRSDERMSLYLNGGAVLLGGIGEGTFKKYTFVTVTRSGDDFKLYFDDTLEDSATSALTVTPTTDIEYYHDNKGLLGPLHIWTRALTQGEIQGLYNSSPAVVPVLSNESVTITDGFSTQSLNWERR